MGIALEQQAAFSRMYHDPNDGSFFHPLSSSNNIWDTPVRPEDLRPPSYTCDALSNRPNIFLPCVDGFSHHKSPPACAYFLGPMTTGRAPRNHFAAFEIPSPQQVTETFSSAFDSTKQCDVTATPKTMTTVSSLDERFCEEGFESERIRKCVADCSSVKNRNKRKRTAFSPTQLLEMEEEFRSGQYVNKNRRIALAVSLNLSERQVKVW